MPRTIHRTVSLALIAAVLLPLGGAILTVRLISARDMNRQLIDSRTRLVEAASREAGTVMTQAVNHLHSVRRIPTMTGRNDNSPQDEMSALMRLYFSGVALFDTSGYLVEAAGTMRMTREESPWFRAAMDRQTVILTPPMHIEEIAGLGMRIYIPVPPANAGDTAVVRAVFPFRDVQDALDRLDAGTQGTILLTDSSGNILYSRDRTRWLLKSGITPLPAQDDGLDRVVYAGQEQIAVSAVLTPSWQLDPGRNWTLSWMEPADSFLRPVHDANVMLLKIAGGAATLAALAAWLLARRLTDPVRRVAAAADRAARGDLDVHLPPSDTLEMSVLADSCNKMFSQLRENRTILENEVELRTAELSKANQELEVAFGQLRQAQKMEAVGTMAGGIAHDFNNLLTAINGNLQLALEQGHLRHGPTAEHLQRARAAGDRATGVVRSLLAFSRRNSVDLRSCDITALVEETYALLRPTLDPRITLTLIPPAEPSNVRADAGQVGQVIMNLCINARDAIGERGGITLRILRETIEQNGELSPATSPLTLRRPGDFVCVEVQDTGSGIPPELLSRIFEPFFTTKAPNKGSGLGLAMCYGICQQHGGWIECRPGPEQRGTVFSVYLPWAAASAPVALTRPQRLTGSIAPTAGPHPSTIRVLIADDEDTVRLVAEGVLRKQGYQVFSAVNGLEALEACRTGQIDLVVLDGAMPVMSGHEAFEAISREMPHIPVVVCTGNLSAREEFRTADGREPAAFVEKPYSFPAFIAAVRSALIDRVPAEELFALPG